MASIMSNVECPQCKKTALEDFYYKTDETFLCCFHCGYYYQREQKYDEAKREMFTEEKEWYGYGVYSLVKNDGSKGITKVLNVEITEDEKEEMIKSFESKESKDVDMKKSYFILYDKGAFTLLAGTYPKDFQLSYKEWESIYDTDDSLSMYE
ncbi:hypothetical protein LGQ02_12240 [Bacillus shivajii]|uniref:hypothetical protein n=1 Tax=Bacillus shivajii TaxID=1983719 RepID=UPI001CFB7743|nr:hypothetical protein [Bacillus shivajii]UCZ51633.1 hypothetical protein LGQ02_12240 [Bacillus shivajii]